VKNEDALTRASIFKKVIDICKKNTLCTYCDYSNGVVKKIGGTFKIAHEKYRAKQPQSEGTGASWLFIDIFCVHNYVACIYQPITRRCYYFSIKSHYSYPF
jgi:hypothetical protein